MNKQSPWIQILLLPLAVANLIGILYLQPSNSSAASTTEVTQEASKQCRCPKSPTGN